MAGAVSEMERNKNHFVSSVSNPGTKHTSLIRTLFHEMRDGDTGVW